MTRGFLKKIRPEKLNDTSKEFKHSEEPYTYKCKDVAFICYGESFAHSGVQGMKWGYSDGQRVAGKRTAADELAEAVKNKDYATVQDRVNKLHQDGYSPYAIQAIVNGMDPDEAIKKFGEPKTDSEHKSDEDIATDVIKGKYGNGEDRKKALEAAGYDYKTVQSIVNQRLIGNSSGKSSNKDSNKDSKETSKDKTDSKKATYGADRKDVRSNSSDNTEAHKAVAKTSDSTAEKKKKAKTSVDSALSRIGNIAAGTFENVAKIIRS